MSTDLIVALIGIALTVFFGFLGLRALKKQRQKQVTKGGAIAIQSGRDTNIRTPRE